MLGERVAFSKKAKHLLRFSDNTNKYICWIILSSNIPIEKGAVAKCAIILPQLLFEFFTGW